jgi:hypothetical protein
LLRFFTSLATFASVFFGFIFASVRAVGFAPRADATEAKGGEEPKKSEEERCRSKRKNEIL